MTFTYRGIDSSGVLTEGQEEGDREEIIVRLVSRGITLLDLKSQTDPAVAKEPLWRLPWGGISQSSIAFFTRQLSELLDAGIPLVEALQSLIKFSANPRLTEVLQQVCQDIQQGVGLSDSLARHPSAFSPLYVALFRVGESTGSLNKMVNSLANYLERDMETRSKVRSALTYPLFILAFSLLLAYLMVAYLLPTFEPMWRNAKLDLHKYPVTIFLMQLSNLSHNIVGETTVIVLLCVIYAGVVSLAKTEKGGYFLDHLLLRMPVLGRFVMLGSVSRIAATFGTMMDAGSGFLGACDKAADVAGNKVMSQALQQISREVSTGCKLSQAFEKQNKVFPAMFIQMIAIGEQSGQLDRMLPRMARYFESQLDSSIKTFSSLVEPVMMVVVGGVVFAFVIGVFMPIMGIVSSMQSHM